MNRDFETATETDRERFLRRAREVRELVASVDPSLLDRDGVDESLLDLTLSRSVLERLEAAYRNRLEMDWLQGLVSEHAQGRR